MVADGERPRSASIPRTPPAQSEGWYRWSPVSKMPVLADASRPRLTVAEVATPILTVVVVVDAGLRDSFALTAPPCPPRSTEMAGPMAVTVRKV